MPSPSAEGLTNQSVPGKHKRMTLPEYQRYYIDFVQAILVPAVRREAHVDTRLQADIRLQQALENKTRGLIILTLIAFIESNFLAKSDLKALRSFQTPLSSLPSGIIPRRLSCFVYIRDAFAHDPSGVLLSQGANTVHFTTAIADGSFPWATISGQEIFISPQAAHELHLDILRFFGAP